MSEDAGGEPKDEAGESRAARSRAAVRGLDEQTSLVKVVKAIRRLLPGDSEYGDPLSVAGSDPTQRIGARFAALTAERPSALREVGLTALQVWQAFSEAEPGGQVEREVAILFTDLVAFSSWALEAGDQLAVELLRTVGKLSEPPIEAHGGEIVKRLGDGLMAVFDNPQSAVTAALVGSRSLVGVEVDGYRPRLRAGVHVGTARKLGGDYFGVDVNVAARIAAAAKGGEVLVSEAAREMLDETELRLKRRWRFRAKGAPGGLRVYAAQLRD